MKINFFNRKYIAEYIIVLLMTILLVISAILYNTKNYGKRRTFVFPAVEVHLHSSDKKSDEINSVITSMNIIETRYLLKNPIKSDVAYYIDELLLGPTTERTKFLFTPGTKILSCFERNQVLYLNLSDDLLKMGENVIDIKEGIELLKNNIFMNFKHIKSVEIFVNGVLAYEENTDNKEM